MISTGFINYSLDRPYLCHGPCGDQDPIPGDWHRGGFKQQQLVGNCLLRVICENHLTSQARLSVVERVVCALQEMQKWLQGITYMISQRVKCSTEILLQIFSVERQVGEGREQRSPDEGWDRWYGLRRKSSCGFTHSLTHSLSRYSWNPCYGAKPLIWTFLLLTSIFSCCQLFFLLSPIWMFFILGAV